jgi:hypothetical protein
MPEKEKEVETTDTDTSPETDGNEGGLSLTQEELDQMMGERARRAERAAKASMLKELGLESVDDLKETVTAYREKQQAEMSELEKAQAKLDELKAEKADLEAQMRESRIKRAVEAKAQELNFHNPARAYDLMDRSDVDLVEGDVVGVEESLKALVKAEPYLVKQKKAPDIDAQKKGKKIDTDPDEERKQSIYRRHGVRV